MDEGSILHIPIPRYCNPNVRQVSSFDQKAKPQIPRPRVNTRFIASMRGVYCPPPGLCSRWFAIHAVIACMLLVQLEVLLMTEGAISIRIKHSACLLRFAVYAMYDRKLRIKVLLTAVMTSKSIAMAAIVASVCREVVFEDVSCVVQAMPVPALALWSVWCLCRLCILD